MHRIQNDLAVPMSQIIPNFQNCVLHVLQNLVANTDYDKFVFPYALTNIEYVDQCSHERNESLSNVLIFKQNSIRCWVTFLLPKVRREISTSANCFENIFHFYKIKNRLILQKFRFVVVPATIIIFQVRSFKTEQSFNPDHWQQLLPYNPVFVLGSCWSSTQSSTICNPTISGYVKHKSKILQDSSKFRCNSLEDCYPVMVKAHQRIINFGKSTCWQIHDLMSLQSSNKKPAETNPFQRKGHSRLWLSTASFLVQGFDTRNKTCVDVQTLPGIALKKCPSATCSLYLTDDPASDIIKIFLSNLLQVMGFCLEQGIGSAIVNSNFRIVVRIRKIVLAAWFLICIIITNSYKGIIKAHFAVTFPFETHWRFIEELSNFTLYLPGGKCRRTVSRSGLTTVNFDTYKNEFSSRTCMKWPPGKSENEFLYYSLTEEFISLPNSGSRLEGRQFECVCANEWENLILKNLTKQNTAILIQANEFEYFWRKIKILMGSQSSLKFAHNKRIFDGFFRRRKFIYISSGMEDIHKNPAHNRIRTLLSSGIYWMWEKWDKLRYPSEVSVTNTSGLENVQNVKPLSLTGSDINLTFLLLLMCSFCCTAVFLLECTSGFFR
ncbi:unnamed protein product [Allacma fusca]|uniref:Uncharacterized protein n=1 Tax=Allacma fusca TaxID=39272 RepID=A0A8J2NUL1_9HEXA|nr:unnamed protein product [Allacma fusca]